MSQKIEEAIKNLRTSLQEECNPHCVAVDIFFNAEGYEVNYRLRTPGSLKRSGINMRNLKGDFIK